MEGGTKKKDENFRALYHFMCDVARSHVMCITFLVAQKLVSLDGLGDNAEGERYPRVAFERRLWDRNGGVREGTFQVQDSAVALTQVI